MPYYFNGGICGEWSCGNILKAESVRPIRPANGWLLLTVLTEGRVILSQKF
jgi:hypothetical protein